MQENGSKPTCRACRYHRFIREKDINERASEWLQQDNDYEYKCTDIDVKISEKTGRVYEITFK